MAKPTDDRRFLSPMEVAKLMGVTRKTVYKMLRRGDLDGRKFGGQWRVPRRVIDGDDDRTERVAAV